MQRSGPTGKSLGILREPECGSDNGVAIVSEFVTCLLIESVNSLRKHLISEPLPLIFFRSKMKKTALQLDYGNLGALETREIPTRHRYTINVNHFDCGCRVIHCDQQL